MSARRHRGVHGTNNALVLAQQLEHDVLCALDIPQVVRLHLVASGIHLPQTHVIHCHVPQCMQAGTPTLQRRNRRLLVPSARRFNGNTKYSVV